MLAGIEGPGNIACVLHTYIMQECGRQQNKLVLRGQKRSQANVEILHHPRLARQTINVLKDTFAVAKPVVGKPRSKGDSPYITHPFGNVLVAAPQMCVFGAQFLFE